MRQIVNKKVVTLIIILLVAILLFLMVSIYANKGLIKQITSEILKQEEEKAILDGISCRVLDNTGEKIKAFVTITRESGIESIEYLANDGEILKLNCNNKQKVTIDTEMLVNEEQQFKVTSNGEEKIETVSLNENYIDEYIKYIKLDNDEPYDQIDIQFTPVQNSLNYYKINNGPWNTYSSTLSLDISNVVLEKLQNKEYDTTIYTMSVDSSGNTLVANKTIELTKKCPNFNLFHNMDISGKTNLTEYGLQVTSWGGADWRWFDVRNMGGGHQEKIGSFSIVITMDWNNPNSTFDNISTKFSLYAEYGANVTAGITINYVDGTSNSADTGKYQDGRKTMD